MTNKERKQADAKWKRIEAWWMRPLSRIDEPRPIVQGRRLSTKKAYHFIIEVK